MSVVAEAMPLAKKPVPVVVTPEMCTAAVPVFVSVEESVLLAPTFTVPKLNAPGLALSWPSACVVPEPLTVIVAGEPETLLVIVIFPDIAPVAVGE